jgi:hypothetical protein
MARIRLGGGAGALLLALSTVAAAHAQNTPTSQSLFVFTGSLPGAHVGAVVGNVGDADGDGRADLLVGSENLLTVYSGANLRVLYTIPADRPGDFERATILPVSDLDGDGRADFLVAAPGADNGDRVDAGGIFLHSAATGARIRPPSLGSAAGQRYGAAAILTGDLNNDGVPDAVIGAPGVNNGAGAINVVSLKNGNTIRTFLSSNPGERLGSGLAGFGDLSGDGVPDIAIGAPLNDPSGRQDAGRVVFFSVVGNGRILDQVFGAEAGGQFGATLANGGDVNGDGRADLIIGAPNRTAGDRPGAGLVFVLSIIPRSTIYRLEGAAAGDGFGTIAAGGTDINGDNRPDILVGAPLADVEGRADAGSIQVFSGADGRSLLALGGGAGDQLGAAATFLTDISGDARADILVGAPLFDALLTADVGAAVVLGAAGGGGPGGGDPDGPL